MKLRTEIELSPYPVKISYTERILSVGSCFAENITEKLSSHFFNVLGNPFGVLYNPVSVFNMFLLAEEKRELKKDDLIFAQDEWHSFYHNSEFSDESAEIVLSKTNESILKLNEFLKKADVVIITYGTSFVYEFIERNLIVSNCHKIPQKFFNRRMLEIEESTDYIRKTVEVIRAFNKDAKVILTVSPVRHVKDGLHGNQLSKARLLLAVEKVVSKSENLFYFPSYEIVIDDLRDYRFYAEDLVHPNKVAVAYIWEKFSVSFLDEAALKFYNDVEPLVKALSHRPVNPKSNKHRRFLESNLELLKKLKERYSSIDFSLAEKFFQEGLNKFRNGR